MDTHGDESLVKMVNRCARFALAIKENQSPRWITLMGVTGTGKTHCGTRLWNAFNGKFKWHNMNFIHKPVYWPQFVSKLRSKSGYEQLEEMQRWPLLMLDDIGAERDTSGFSAEQLNTLLGCRIGRWTVITSNLNLEQLGAIDPRIADRAIRAPNIFCEVNTESHSLRMLKK